MSIETLPGTDTKYYLICFDRDGRERTDDNSGKMSTVIVDALRTSAITDVFVFSHGWKGDIPAARQQYNRWIGAMLQCQDDVSAIRHARPGFQPLFVGVHWPSLPFGEEDFDAAPSAFSISESDPREEFVAGCADRVVDTLKAREAYGILFDALAENAAPPELPEQVKKAYDVINEEAGMACLGIGGAPGLDREVFDANRLYLHSMDSAVNFGGDFASGLLAPLVQLSFWKMKDRARAIGESGGFNLLSAMQDASDGRDIRFHLMGHSFGCIVASAMVAGSKEHVLRKPVSSMALIQGALSHWSYCNLIPYTDDRPGYFHKIIARKLVNGPIVTTQSEHDRAVAFLYPLAAGVAGQVDYAVGELPKYAALGAFGACGPGVDTVSIDMLPVNKPYDLKAGSIFNVDGSKYIRHGGGISGAHSDIANEGVAHLVWSAAISR